MREVAESLGAQVDINTFYHTNNGAFSEEVISLGLNWQKGLPVSHLEVGHDLMGRAGWDSVRDVTQLTLYRYFNRCWKDQTSQGIEVYRTASISRQDGYQTTRVIYSYVQNNDYPVRFDAVMGAAIYNKVTEQFDDGGQSGKVDTYSYNGHLLPPPNAPVACNALDHSTAMIGATYCTIATGADGAVVSTSKTLHQVYAVEKGGAGGRRNRRSRRRPDFSAADLRHRRFRQSARKSQLRRPARSVERTSGCPRHLCP
jgi:hypothetical protein